MSAKNRIAAIIVAAGMGVRMGTAQKKQYTMLGKRPVLAHSLSAFDTCDAIEEVFLVIPEGDQDFCRQEILDPLKLHKPVHMVSGGVSRQESVFNGLKATEGRFDVVAIHDGVRPLVKTDRISKCIETAERYGACILAVSASDTVKIVDNDDCVQKTLKRPAIRMAQTPQAFRFKDIMGAHLAAEKEDYMGTDDAELVERRGGAVKIIPGERSNIKITTPEDLRIAEALLEME